MATTFKKDQKVKIKFSNFTNSDIISRYGGRTFTIGRVEEGNKGLHTKYFLLKSTGKTIKSPNSTTRSYPFIERELELVG